MSEDLRRAAMKALPGMEELDAGLRDNNPGAIAEAREMLHALVDAANGVKLRILLLGVLCTMQNAASTGSPLRKHEVDDDA